MMQLSDESNWRRKPLFLSKSVKESKNRKKFIVSGKYYVSYEVRAF